MKIKTAVPADYPAIAQLIVASFTATPRGYGDEAELVTNIRQQKNFDPELEIIAVSGTTIVGHGLLSPVTVVTADGPYAGLVLAPLDIAPSYQRQGLGATIIRELERRATARSSQFSAIPPTTQNLATFRQAVLPSPHRFRWVMNSS